MMLISSTRVIGVLAVTRSLGDSAMKEFVVGSPYTTETTLGPDDDYLIIACDGVRDELSLIALLLIVTLLSSTAVGCMRRPRSRRRNHQSQAIRPTTSQSRPARPRTFSFQL